VTAHPARPILRIVGDAREQFARARRLDDGDDAVAPELRALGLERHEEVQLLASVSVGAAEQRGIGDVQIRLVERDLGSVLGKRLFEPVALDAFKYRSRR